MKNETVFLHGKHIRKDGTFDTFWTMEVLVKDAPLQHHLDEVSFTASGYGSRIPTRKMVLFNGRWRRVYCRIYSNSGTCYLLAGKDESITVG